MTVYLIKNVLTNDGGDDYNHYGIAMKLPPSMNESGLDMNNETYYAISYGIHYHQPDNENAVEIVYYKNQEALKRYIKYGRRAIVGQWKI